MPDSFSFYKFSAKRVTGDLVLSSKSALFAMLFKKSIAFAGGFLLFPKTLSFSGALLIVLGKSEVSDSN